MTEFVVQPTESVDDERRIGDSCTIVIEGVGEAFEAAAILTDGHVSLKQVVELLLGKHSPLEAVVKKLPRDRRPCRVSGGAGPVDVVPDLLRHGGVEPGDDTGVDLEPLWIVEHGGGVDGAIDVVGDAELNLEPLWIVEHGGGVDGAIDVVGDAELLDNQFKEGKPLPEVAFISGEDYGNVVADVEQHEGRCWGRIRAGKGIVVGGSMRAGH